jgi:hypothetical protein
MEKFPNLKQLIGILGLTNIASAGVLSMLPSRELVTRAGEPWSYGVIGDSWGSGVAWKKDLLYDDNKGECLRTKESHGPQLEGDDKWLGFKKTTLHDAACSGRSFGNIVKGEHQMGQVGSPHLVVMTAGGKQAGFGHIVEACIYHPDPQHNYGKAYKDDQDRKGDCAVALDGALQYINKPADKPQGLEYDLRKTLDDLFKDPAVSSSLTSLVYVTGYAQFWGTDYDDWCNTQYWNVPSAVMTPAPYLSKELRKTFNDHVAKVNQIYKKVTEDPKYKKQTRFVDVDKGFAGHRFCEPGATYQDQIDTDTHSKKVYLWNLNYPWKITGQGAPSAEAAEGQISAAEAKDLFKGQGVTAWVGSRGDEGNKPENGWRQRPFHPRYSGYTTIKDAIVAQMKADNVPTLPSSTKPVAPTCSHVGNGKCRCSDGETPDVNEDNQCIAGEL